MAGCGSGPLRCRKTHTGLNSTILVLIEGHDEHKPVVRGLGAESLGGPHLAHRAAIGPNSDVIVVTSGVGPQRAGRVTADCIRRFDPCLVVSAGTCGALIAGLELSDWLVTGTVRSLGPAGDSGRAAGMTLESSAVAEISRLRSVMGTVPRIHHGMLVTVSDQPVVGEVEKAAIARRHDAVAVDMESFGIAEAAAACGIPWLIARVVVDTPSRPLPELGAMNSQSGRPPLGGIARYLLMNPIGGPRTLYSLWALVNEYARTLVRVLPALFTDRSPPALADTNGTHRVDAGALAHQ